MEATEQMVDKAPADSREQLFEELYEKAFPAFARFSSSMNGSFDDAKDVFHDALVIFYEKYSSNNFVITVSAQAYVLGIARHLWLRKFKQDRHSISLTMAEAEIPADYFPTVNEMKLFSFLEKSGKKCLELLHQFYFEKKSLRKIAMALGYSSEHSATVQKFKCIGKLRDAARFKAVNYEDFLS